MKQINIRLQGASYVFERLLGPLLDSNLIWQNFYVIVISLSIPKVLKIIKKFFCQISFVARRASENLVPTQFLSFQVTLQEYIFPSVAQSFSKLL